MNQRLPTYSGRSSSLLSLFRLLLILIAGLSVIVFVSISLMSRANERRKEEKRMATYAVATLEKNARETSLGLAGSVASHASAIYKTNKPHSLLLATEAHRIIKEAGGAPPLAVQNAIRQVLAAGTGKLLNEPEGAAITDIVMSADDRWLVTLTPHARQAHLWNLTVTGVVMSPVSLSEADAWATAAVFSPDGHWLVTPMQDNTMRLWDLTAANVAASKLLLTSERHVTRALFSPGSQWLVTHGDEHQVYLWSFKDNTPPTEPIILPPPPGPDEAARSTSPITAVTFDQQEQWLAIGSQDAAIRLWLLATPTLDPVVLEGPTSSITSLTYSGDDNWLVATSQGAAGKQVHVWSLSLDHLVDLACKTAETNFTSEEWAYYFPTLPYHKTCPTAEDQ